VKKSNPKDRLWNYPNLATEEEGIVDYSNPIDMVVGSYMVVVVAVDMHVQDKRCEVLLVDRMQVGCMALAHKVQEARCTVGDMDTPQEHDHWLPEVWQAVPVSLEVCSTATSVSLDQILTASAKAGSPGSLSSQQDNI